jgi:hypothetical protein
VSLKGVVPRLFPDPFVPLLLPELPGPLAPVAYALLRAAPALVPSLFPECAPKPRDGMSAGAARKSAYAT